MARYTSQQMTQQRPAGQPAPAKADGKPAQQSLRVPQGGQVTIRRVDNGLIASSVDANYRAQGEVFVKDASDLKITE
ncbi:hypothetical protein DONNERLITTCHEN_00020 [Janthinobacterium phage vB_JliS-Donnerlittchen]|uniref:Uncharacterized protein n=1 Tax=Janthinobacterium phage vB_JliS-Donnerlittchen TaxID=2948610 RepID=A0A9E7MPS9_9CAUD|nr:hypothetical protein P9A49_gp03 [Janthinobacterium phage vB_JliM-Donnerlittchen]USN14403.1 hypothetical protein DONNERLITTCHEN_00020 [Janthinobacterium phage vB_JliM-Donnerlittchen]